MMTDEQATAAGFDFKSPAHVFALDCGRGMAAVVQARLVLQALYGRITDPLVETDLRLVEMRMCDLHQLTLDLAAQARDAVAAPIGRDTSGGNETPSDAAMAGREVLRILSECLIAVTQIRLAIEAMRNHLTGAGLTSLEVRALEERIEDAGKILDAVNEAAPKVLGATATERPGIALEVVSATPPPVNDRITIH